jgi:hypothetical protein
MDPDQTARMRRLVWIHAGRKRITLVLSWRAHINAHSKSIYFFQKNIQMIHFYRFYQ